MFSQTWPEPAGFDIDEDSVSLAKAAPRGRVIRAARMPTQTFFHNMCVTHAQRMSGARTRTPLDTMSHMHLTHDAR
jgi:hypothetical protein